MKRIFKFVRNTVLATAGLGAAALFAMKAPDIHNRWLTNKVGSVVIKITKDKTQQSGGTGFHVKAPSGKTYIMTNAHVCRLGLSQSTDGTVLVSLPQGNRMMNRRVLEMSSTDDLCILEPLPGLEGIETADSIELGDTITVVGYPMLTPKRSASGQYIARDKIEVLIAEVDDEQECKKMVAKAIPLLFTFGCVKVYDAMESNARIFPGNSGSPGVSFYSRLVGVAFAGDSDGVSSFFVPLDRIKKFLEVY